MSESHYLRFDAEPRKPRRKTQDYHVVSLTTQTVLGAVRYYASWRKYVFYPADEVLFDAGCLREIADFCTKQTVAIRVGGA